MNAKPLPDVTDLNQIYWEGTKKGELRIRECNVCKARFRFAHAWCPNCGDVDPGWTRASGKATVTHFSVVHRAPYAAFEDVVPYVLALVELEEGVRMMCNIIDCDPKTVRVGLPVTVTFEPRGDIALPQFRPR